MVIKEEIGNVAGEIWQHLNRNNLEKCTSIKDLSESLNREEFLILLALGWLAREDKIKFTMYREGMCVELV